MKKTFQWLDDHHVEYEFVDLKKTPFTSDELSSLTALVGLDTLINRRGMMWKRLGLANKSLNNDELFQELLAHQTMIKRPVIIGEDNAVLVGFDEDSLSAFLLPNDEDQ